MARDILSDFVQCEFPSEDPPALFLHAKHGALIAGGRVTLATFACQSPSRGIPCLHSRPLLQAKAAKTFRTNNNGHEG
jgi:hypothetical protein